MIFRPDPTVWDGRFANNGWLQEAPKPLTKLTWDTAAWISPRLAESGSLDRGDVIELRYRGLTRADAGVHRSRPARRSVTVFFGYGRRMSGRVGNASEQAQAFNAFLLRTSDAPWFGSGLEIAKTGERYLLATTQDHHAMEGRAPRAGGTLAQYEARPGGHPRTWAHTSAQDADAVSRPRVQGQQVGHGDRPHVLHRLRRLRRRLRGREQHPGRRQGAGAASTARCTGSASTTTSPATSIGRSRCRRCTSRCPACSARTRRARSSAPWRRRRTARKA